MAKLIDKILKEKEILEGYRNYLLTIKKFAPFSGSLLRHGPNEEPIEDVREEFDEVNRLLDLIEEELSGNFG